MVRTCDLDMVSTFVEDYSDHSARVPGLLGYEQRD